MQRKVWLITPSSPPHVVSPFFLFSLLSTHISCNSVGQAMDIASDISKVLDHHSKLSKMSDPTTTESHSIPNIERAINSFSTSLQSLSEFNALPELVDRVVRLLQERQNYEIMVTFLLLMSLPILTHAVSHSSC